MATEQTISASTGEDTTFLATCHCGRVRVQIPKPTKLNECHCSVCYKYGALWAYFKPDEVKIEVADDTTLNKYIRSDSDGDISFDRCGHCGCLINWKGLGEYSGPEHQMVSQI